MPVHDPDPRVVVATRFSRLRSQRDAATPLAPADLQLEALGALAEGLDLVAALLRSLDAGPRPPAARLRRFGARAELLVATASRDANGRECTP